MRRLLLLLGGLLLCSAGAGSAVYVSDQSRFCGSCHSMVPIHASWANSPHAHVPDGKRPAGCVDCHVRPGALGHVAAKLNGLDEVLIEFTRDTPTTRVAAPHFLFAANCMSCHADLLERDANEEKVRTGRLKEVGLRFPHGLHLAMAEFTPALAARLAELDARRETLDGREKDEREWCVRARKANCAACHGPAPRAGEGEDPTARKLADPATNFRAENPMNCVTCHKGIGHATNPRFGFAVPPVENCAQCHTGRAHGTLGVVFEAECHGGTDEAACLKCHPGIPRKLLKDLPLER